MSRATFKALVPIEPVEPSTTTFLGDLWGGAVGMGNGGEKPRSPRAARAERRRR
ncbi:MAG: hypothetical protein R3F11_04950 [Verrucomicrobiales bacterium]